MEKPANLHASNQVITLWVLCVGWKLRVLCLFLPQRPNAGTGKLRTCFPVSVGNYASFVKWKLLGEGLYFLASCVQGNFALPAVFT